MVFVRFQPSTYGNFRRSRAFHDNKSAVFRRQLRRTPATLWFPLVQTLVCRSRILQLGCPQQLNTLLNAKFTFLYSLFIFSLFFERDLPELTSFLLFGKFSSFRELLTISRCIFVCKKMNISEIRKPGFYFF